jgi:hypothetical protein
MSDIPPRSLGAAANVLEWIWEEETLEGRLQRIQHFLENEGYLLPEPPRGVDRSEEGCSGGSREARSGLWSISL